MQESIAANFQRLGRHVIMESHLTIHTWPEHRYAAVDFFTCGESPDPQRAHAYLSQAPGATASHPIARGETLRLDGKPVGVSVVHHKAQPGEGVTIPPGCGELDS